MSEADRGIPENFEIITAPLSPKFRNQDPRETGEIFGEEIVMHPDTVLPDPENYPNWKLELF